MTTTPTVSHPKWLLPAATIALALVVALVAMVVAPAHAAGVDGEPVDGEPVESDPAVAAPLPPLPPPWSADDVESAVTVDVDGAPAPLAISTPGRIAIATFTAEAGADVGLGLTDVSGFRASTIVQIAVRAPDGTTLATAATFGTADLELRDLPVNGTYLITFDPVGAGVGSLTVIASTPATASTAIAREAVPTTVAMTRRGQDGLVTFTAPEAAQTALDVTPVAGVTTATPLLVTLRGPDGGTVTSFAVVAETRVLLPPLAAGVHEIALDPVRAGTATVQVAVVDVGPEPEPEPEPELPVLAADRDPDLSAIFECVVDHGDGTLTARFGYENREVAAPDEFRIPAGPDNRLAGDVLTTAGPVEAFVKPDVVPGRPGRTPFGQGAFTVTFADTGSVVWLLHGRTATAGGSSKRCADG